MVDLPDEIHVPGHDLVLRPWRIEHWRQVLAAVEVSLPELRRWMPWAMEPPTEASVRAFLEGAGAHEGFGLFEADGELVGAFGLHDRQGPGILEIGYWVRSDRTGRGYATAVARVLTDSGFQLFPDVERMEIRCDPENRASGAIPAKLGYRCVNDVEVPIEAEAQTGRQLVWAVTRDEWRYLATERW